MLFHTYTTTVLAENTYIEDDNDEAQVKIDYPLNSLYKKLLGKIVLPKTIDSVGINVSDNIIKVTMMCA